MFAEGDSARAARYQTIERSIARARDPMQTLLPRILIMEAVCAPYPPAHGRGVVGGVCLHVKRLPAYGERRRTGQIR